MVYMITYDLNSPGQNYEDVIEAIKDCSYNKTYCSYWKSSYMIKSYLTAQQISDKITPLLDGNDRLIVIEVTKNYQGWLTKKQWDYIRQMFD